MEAAFVRGVTHRLSPPRFRTMRGGAQCALKILGNEVRAIHLLRDFVTRAISYHEHLVARRMAPVSFDEAFELDLGLRAAGPTLCGLARTGRGHDKMMSEYGCGFHSFGDPDDTFRRRGK